jgi:xylulokinase
MADVPTGLCCGIDVGTTNLKVVLVDGGGRIRWSRAVPTPRIADEFGPVTDAPSLLAAVEGLVVEGWTSVGEGIPLRAIAVAGVGEDGMVVAPDGTLAETAIPWFDGRAADEAEELAVSDAASPVTGIRVDAARTAAKWLWLARRRPAPAGHWIALTDWPAVAWTSRRFISETLATRTAAYDVGRRAWHAPMLAAAMAPPLPEVIAAGHVIGPVTAGGLTAAGAADRSTRVVAGGHDHPIAAAWIRRFVPNAIVDSMGTAELVYAETDRRSTDGYDPLLAWSVPVGGGPGFAALGVQAFAERLEPFRRTSHGDIVAEVLASGRSTADPTPSGDRAIACGIGPAELSGLPRGRVVDLCVAAIEATALRLRDMILATGADGPVYLTGGFSRSEVLAGLKADVLGRTVFRPEVEETTAVGAALIAWSAVPDFDPARLDPPVTKTIEPDPRRARLYGAIPSAGR